MKYAFVAAMAWLATSWVRADPTPAEPLILAQANPEPKFEESPQAPDSEAKTKAEAKSDVKTVAEDVEEDEVDPSVSGEYEEEEDTFIPSQEVSSDQSLKFPVDI